MTAPRFVEIDGKRHLWRDVLRARREQREAKARTTQPALFPLYEDRRPPSERTAQGRYTEPLLFSRLEQEG